MMIPYAVVRVNNLPLKELQSLTCSSAVEAAAARLSQTKAELDGCRAAVCHVLYERAAREPQHYRELIELKRSIFKGTPAQELLHRYAGLMGTLAELADWVQLCQQLVAAELSLDTLFEAELLQARQHAQRLAKVGHFVGAAAFARGQIADAAHAYASTSVFEDKKSLNNEETVYRYLTRAVAKVSPFSTFTSVGFAPLAEDTGPTVTRGEALEHRYSQDQSTLLKLFERFVVRHKEQWRYRLTSNMADVDSQRLAYLFVDRADIYPYRTSLAKTAVKAAESGIYAVLAQGWTRWPEMAAFLPASVDAGKFLAKWIASGLLLYEPRLEDQGHDLLQQFLAIANRVAANDATARPVVAGLAGIQSGCDALKQAAGLNRRQAVEDINAAFLALAEVLECAVVKRSGFVFHDSYLPVLSGVEPSKMNRFAVQAEEFLCHYLGYNYRPAFSETALAQLRSAFPAGRAMDVFAFNELLQRTLGAHSTDAERPTPPLLALYAEVWNKRGAAELRLVQKPLPSGHRRRAFCAYGHVVADRFVLNNLDSGYLRCFSRFFTFTDNPAVLTACRQAYAGALDAAHDFYDTFGFNTARRPRICRGRIWLDTASAPAEGDLTLQDLQLVWPEEQRLPTLRHRVTLAPVQLRHTALCVSMLYPRLLENLLLVSTPEDACYFAFRFGLFKQVEALSGNSVVQFPRVLYGDLVLSRRQWWVPKTLLPQRKATDSAPTYFKRVDEWRRALGLPQRVFVRRHQLDKVLERDISNLKKPMFVDFSAPIMTRMIGRALNTGFDYLSAEEMLPDHEHSFVSDGVSPYASEIIIEQACES